MSMQTMSKLDNVQVEILCREGGGVTRTISESPRMDIYGP